MELYRTAHADGRAVVLGTVDGRTAACLAAGQAAAEAAWQAAAAGSPEGGWDAGWEEGWEDEPAGADEVAWQEELGRHRIVWQILSDRCDGRGACCETTELGLILSSVKDPSSAATAHLTAVTITAGALSEAAEHLVGGLPTPAGLHPDCTAHPVRHARACEHALHELTGELAVATSAHRMAITVEDAG